MNKFEERVWLTKLDMIDICAHLLSISCNQKRDISFEPISDPMDDGYFFTFGDKDDFRICCRYLFTGANEPDLDSYVDASLRRFGKDGSGIFKAELKAIN